MYGLNKYMIDITIETLAGTKFSLKVSKLDKIQSIKLKIQRHEGIPVSHQHLIWQSNELEDQCSLNDYNIPNGATLKMVLALRGGPINTRRINTEDIYDLMEIQEDSNQWNNETAQSVNKHVTLVFYKDGDRYSFFKIIDRADAASPTSGAMSAASMYVPYDETEQDPSGGQGGGATTSAATTLTDGLASLLNKSATAKSSKFVPRRRKSAVNENRKTKEKMNAIKNRLSQHRKQIQQQQQQKQEQNSINPEAAKATDSSNDTKTTTSESSTQSVLNGLSVQNEPLTNVKRPSSVKTNVRGTELVQNDSQSQKRTEVVNENGYKFYDDDYDDDDECTISDQENCYQEYAEDDDEDDDDQEGEVDDEDEDEYDDDEEVDEEDEYDEDEDEYDDQEDEEDDDEDEENEVVEDDDYGPSHGEPSAQENYLSQSCENVNGMTNNSELNEFDPSAGAAATTATVPTATNNEDENEVDNDENDLLLNKSEFLLNEDVHQINNSPTGGLTNTDLMAIMMMTVNSDQISLNGVSSSLATTALPTVLTPIYTTDNENFFIPYSSGSAGTRSKYIRKSNKYKNANKINRTRNRKLVTDTEQAPDALTQPNSTNLDEASVKMMQKQQYRQKQKKRKRQLLANQVKPEPGEDPNTAEQAKITDKPLVANRRKPTRKRNSDLKPSDLQQIASAAVAFSPTAILLRTISFENSRKLIKESNQRRLKRIDQTQQPIDQTETTTEKSDEPSSEEAKQESNSSNQENETETNVKPKETINSSVTSLRKITSAIANPNRTISGSTKRVSFTVDDESDTKAAESTVNATTASGEQKSTAERENKLTMSRNTSMLDALSENTTTNDSSSSPVANAPPTITTASVLVASENTTTSANRPPIIKSTIKQQQPYMSTFDENVAGYNQIKNHLKPSVWANYRQKPPPKLDSLYHQTHQDINMQATTTAVKSMDKHVESSLNVNENLLTKSHPNSYNYNTKHTPPSTNLQIPQQSTSSNTGLATATTTYSDYSKPLLNARRSQPDSGSSVNKLEAFKNNLGPSSILKTYQNSNLNQNSASIYANNTNNIRNSIVENNNNSGNLTSTIEITRILSGSSNNRMSRQYSISSNDLAQSQQQQQQQQQTTSKPLKLPPVNSNLNKPDTAGSSLLIGGSTNNINSIGLNDTASIPIKKFNDLSRYCNFCRKKTGLASSYICRCGNNYCTQHRNAEAHNCTYDYKTEGRKLIEQSNPLVAASKLPKI